MSEAKESRYPISDHYDGSRFFNPWKPDMDKGFGTLLKWQFTAEKKSWPAHRPVIHKPQLKHPLDSQQWALSFVNHSTYLIQSQKHNILTDPVWSERASPVSFAGPKRIHEPGIDFETLPQIHVVLLSHNHYDHLDLRTLKKLYERFKPLILVPLGDKKLLESEGIRNVKEMDWWESTKIDDLEIHFTPAQHWSSRGLFDRRKSLWGSYFLKDPQKTLYFGGDTGFGPHFLEIHKRFGAPKLALLPIGAYEPRWFMKEAHMNPNDAVNAHKVLCAEFSAALHFGTFQLTDEGIDDPKQDLEFALDSNSLPKSTFWVPEPGQTRIF